MYLLKDKTLIIILLVMLIGLCSCSKKDKEFDRLYQINEEEIFDINEVSYYVYFYKNDCPYCDDTFDTINKYLHQLNSSDKTKLYVCDLSDINIITYQINFDNTSTKLILKNNFIYKYDPEISSVKQEGNYLYISFSNGREGKLEVQNSKISVLDTYITSANVLSEKKDKSIIRRKYNGIDGQGSSGSYFVDGVRMYSDLYISGVPSLIYINENKISSFVTSGRKSIIEYFETLINNN